jgi:hypothetical protein
VVGGKTTTEDIGIDPIPTSISDLTISISDSNILLEWTHKDSSIVRYEIWRAIDSPYFSPDVTGTKIGEVAPGNTGETLSYSDTDSPLGNANQQGYYLVLPVNSVGQRASPEPHEGEFDFAIIPGD